MKGCAVELKESDWYLKQSNKVLLKSTEQCWSPSP